MITHNKRTIYFRYESWSYIAPADFNETEQEQEWPFGDSIPKLFTSLLSFTYKGMSLGIGVQHRLVVHYLICSNLPLGSK